MFFLPPSVAASRTAAVPPRSQGVVRRHAAFGLRWKEREQRICVPRPESCASRSGSIALDRAWLTIALERLLPGNILLAKPG